MKKILLTIAIFIGVVTSSNIHAQNVNISINIGSQPAWGPVGYDYVDYYYIPDINVYYIINNHRYVYLDGGRWITSRYLPYRYRNYDLYGMYKVVLMGGVIDPWRYNTTHYREYSRYRNYRGQSVIRDTRDNRYRDSRSNYSPWYGDSNSNRATARPTNSNYTRPNNNNASTRPSTSTTRPSTSTTRPSTTTSRPSGNSSTRPTGGSVSNSNRGNSSSGTSTRTSSRSSSSSTRSERSNASSRR